MKTLKFSKKERRIVIILMLINSFALFVNFFHFNAYTETKKTLNKDWGNTITKRYYFFTNRSNHEKFLKNEEGLSNFYPFVNFTYKSSMEHHRSYFSKSDIEKYEGFNKNFIFHGIFPYYDYTEFLVYSLIIFGVPLIRKLW